MNINETEVGKEYTVINGRWDFIVDAKDDEYVTISYYSPMGHNSNKVPINDESLDIEDKFDSSKYKYSDHLYSADPNCDHDVQTLWSGVKCRKCSGWFCY